MHCLLPRKAAHLTKYVWSGAHTSNKSSVQDSAKIGAGCGRVKSAAGWSYTLSKICTARSGGVGCSCTACHSSRVITSARHLYSYPLGFAHRHTRRPLTVIRLPACPM